MDKKEQKRDISSFTHNLKEMMNNSLDNPLVTLDRDLQHFLYGRLAILIKHNNGEPIGSLSDVGTVVGASLGSVVLAFCQNQPADQDLTELHDSIKEGLTYGFNIRTQKPTNSETEEKPETEESAAEETTAE